MAKTQNGRIIISWDCRHISIKMANMVILVLSMVKGSILEVEFILISRGKKLNIKMNCRSFFLLS